MTQAGERTASGNLRVNGDRLLSRLAALARIGATGDGGCRRLALSDEDRQGRDQLMAWLKEVGLETHVDAVGNIVGILPGETAGPAVIMGSHIDTVGTGGKFDGALGVLAALEVIQSIKETGITPPRPLAVIAFTNEEGARFQPDILGSCVWTGETSIEEARAIRDADGKAVGAELDRIGYAGRVKPGFLEAHAYLELHIEQGPILHAEGGGIGAVTGVQAISWTEYTLTGDPNHAGTTPMRYRRNTSLAAAGIIAFADALTHDIEGLVANVGRIVTEPGNVNVVPGRIVMTVDMRHPIDARLIDAEQRMADEIARISAATRVEIASRELARFPAQPFAEELIGVVEQAGKALGLKTRRMHSGAGHDAQIMATVAPTAMIFVPSIDGISHNPRERTEDADVVAGANVLLTAALTVAHARPRA
jgi:N-carbamoyl-L-amino-acid hydrolase